MGNISISRTSVQRKTTKLQRSTQPESITLKLPSPRNPVVIAMAHRATACGAGKHTRSQGAVRRADRVRLQKQLRGLEH